MGDDRDRMVHHSPTDGTKEKHAGE